MSFKLAVYDPIIIALKMQVIVAFDETFLDTHKHLYTLFILKHKVALKVFWAPF